MYCITLHCPFGKEPQNLISFTVCFFFWKVYIRTQSGHILMYVLVVTTVTGVYKFQLSFLCAWLLDHAANKTLTIWLYSSYALKFALVKVCFYVYRIARKFHRVKFSRKLIRLSFHDFIFMDSDPISIIINDVNIVSRIKIWDNSAKTTKILPCETLQLSKMIESKGKVRKVIIIMRPTWGCNLMKLELLWESLCTHATYDSTVWNQKQYTCTYQWNCDALYLAVRLSPPKTGCSLLKHSERYCK